MLSTIPNVKRAEISSTSPKATSQTISHHNPQLPGSESNKSLNSKKNESLTALSFSNDPDGKIGDKGLSKEEQTNPIFDDKRNNVKTELEHHTNSKSIQIEKSANNDRGILANCSANISDMSRRKQRNPKPTLFTSVEDSEHKEETSDEMKILKQTDQEMCVTNHTDRDGTNNKPSNGDTGAIKRHNEHKSEGNDAAENSRSPYSSANSTSSSSPPPHDLSSMVKVEVHEGTSDIGHSMRSTSPHTANPLLVGSRQLVSALEQSQNESPLGRSGGNSLPALIPMPSNYKSLMMTNNAFTMPGTMPSEPGTAFEDPLSISKMMMNEPTTDFPRNLRLSGDELNLALKQNNMFHFGDVSVAHHPDNTPLPMIIPMVYLYPLPPSIDETGS